LNGFPHATVCRSFKIFPKAFYIILSGHVVVLVKECPVAVLGPGETFGELGLQNLEKRTATVKASCAKKLRMDQSITHFWSFFKALRISAIVVVDLHQPANAEAHRENN